MCLFEAREFLFSPFLPASVMSSRAQKVRRLVDNPSEALATLQGLLADGSVSKASLTRVLQTFGKDRHQLELVDVHTASFVLYEQIKVVETLPLINGGTFDWEYLHPCRLLTEQVHASESLQRLLAKVAEVRRDEHLQLIVAFDEYVPGDFKRPVTNRKSMNLVFSFLDLGGHMLMQDALWFTPVTVRTSKMFAVDGAWSCMLKRFFHTFLWGPCGIETAGVALVLCGRPYVLKAKLAVIIADGAGWVQGLEWRGAGSIRPCFKHGNVLKKDCSLSGFVDGFVEIDCSQVDRFERVDAQQFYDDVDSVVEGRRLLASGEISKNKFEELAFVSGVSVTEAGLLADATFRSHVDIFRVMYQDWPHTCLQDGTLTVDMSKFCESCDTKLGIGARFWEGRLRDGWCFPNQIRFSSKQLHQLFNEYRIPTEESLQQIKGTMSQMLGLYGLIRHVVETNAEFHGPEVALERASFYACCEVVDEFVAARTGLRPLAEVAERIRAANTRHLNALVAAYGRSVVKPKNHWVFDIADDIERFADLRFIPNTFTMERLHRDVKKIAKNVLNTKRFEASVLSRLVLAQRRRLCEEHAFNGLRGRTLEHREGVFIGCRLEACGLKLAEGDVVYRGASLAVVMACARVGAELFVIVEELLRVEPHTVHSVKARLAATRSSVWPIHELQVALAWYEGEPDILVVLK
jgi:hypothetical protein